MLNKKNKNYLLISAVFVTAFLVRLYGLFLIFPSQKIFSKYLILGQQLLNDNFFSNRAFSYSPIYCYFIAINKLIFGNSIFCIFFSQIIIGSLFCVVLFLLTQHLINTKMALICVGIACLYRSFVLYELSLLSDFLGAFLQILFVSSLYFVWNRKKISYWIIPGILAGLCILQRPNCLLLTLLALIVMLMYRKTLDRIAEKIGILLITIFFILVPVIIQNFSTAGEAGITVSNPGYIFYSSNNYKNVGTLYHPPSALLQMENVLQERRRIGKEKPRTEVPFEGDAELAKKISSIIQGRYMTLNESSGFYFEETFSFFYYYPKTALKLFFQKFWFIFNGYEPHDVLPVIMKYDTITSITPIAYWMIISTGLIGLFLSLKNWRHWLFLYLILASQIIMMLIFYVVVRFRLPIEAAMIIFSVFAFQQFYNFAIKKQWKTFSLLIVVFAVLFILSNTLNNRMQMHADETYLDTNFQTARTAYNEKNFKKAIYHFKKVIAGEYKYSQRSMTCHNYLAQIYKKLGLKDFEKQEQKQSFVPLDLIVKGLEGKYKNGSISFNQLRGLADLYKAKKNLNKAKTMLEEALKRRPYHPQVRYQLAYIQYQNNKIKPAVKNLKISIRDGILYTKFGLPACFLLANIYEKQSKLQLAKKYYIQAARQIAISQWYPMTKENLQMITVLKKKLLKK